MEAAREMARLAGDLILSRMGGDFGVEAKAQRNDFVTEIDLASERLIRDEISRRFPGHLFHGEEEASGDPEAALKRLSAYGRDDFVWFVDPLDGTGNFIRGLPFFCVSIALARGGELLAGAILDPLRNEMFSAAAGGGAFLNGAPIHVGDVAELGDAVVSTNLPLGEHIGRKRALESIDRVFPRISTTRVFNCAALSLAYVAAGRVDGYWEFGLQVWDLAAGVVLVKEAGGVVEDIFGGSFTVGSRDIVCGGGSVQRALRDTVRG